MKLFKACIVLAAFAALFVMPTIASASPELTHPTGTTATGDHETTALTGKDEGITIEATNVSHSTTAKNTVMTTGLGNLECATATLTGTLITNTGTKIEGEISTAQFNGTPGTPAAAHCSAPGGLGTVTFTPSHTSNPAGGLPWCVIAEGLQNKFIVRGGTCTEVARPLKFTLHSALLGACVYEKAQVEGTYTTHPVDAIMTITEQEFKKISGSGFCPGSGKLDMAFTMFTDGKPTEPIYIS
jgi:hypothetical protein